MKHRNVETTELYLPSFSLRERMLQRLAEMTTLSKKRVKNLISVMAVAVALFGPNGGVDSERAQSVLAQDTIEDIKDDLIQTGQDVAAWVREKGLPAAKEGYMVASENVSGAIQTATPVVERAVKDVKKQVEETVKPAVQGAVANLFDYSISVVNPTEKNPEEVVRSTQESNRTVKLNLADIQDINLTDTINTNENNDTDLDNSAKFYPTVSPEEFGSEIDDLSFRQIRKEKNISVLRPFDYQETNDVFEKLGLSLVDIFNPNYDKIQNFDALVNPNVETLYIFPEKVMEWIPIVEEECARFNALPENKGFEVSPNVALTILTIESGGNEKAYNPSTATGGYQIIPGPEKVGPDGEKGLYIFYIKEGGYDFGEGRMLSYREFNNKLLEKRYATKFFIQYWSDIKRYNQNKYQELGINTPIKELVFQLAEYNGGEGNARLTVMNKNANYENARYAAMGIRIAEIAEIANDLRDNGYTEDYYKMLTSKLVNQRIDEAFAKKSEQGASTFIDTRNILESVGSREFIAGNVTRKLYLDELPDVQPTTTAREATKAEVAFKYFRNPAIDLIKYYEYNKKS